MKSSHESVENPARGARGSMKNQARAIDGAITRELDRIMRRDKAKEERSRGKVEGRIKVDLNQRLKVVDNGDASRARVVVLRMYSAKLLR